MIIGSAGDRPDDTLRGIGRIAAERADRVVIKEMLRYLRGRTRESVHRRAARRRSERWHGPTRGARRVGRADRLRAALARRTARSPGRGCPVGPGALPRGPGAAVDALAELGFAPVISST